MRKILSAVTVSVALGLLGAAWVAVAEAQTTAERFGLGTFSHQNRTFVGVVMRYPTAPQEIGGVVVELPPAANAANVTGDSKRPAVDYRTVEHGGTENQANRRAGGADA